uniref:Uncharacterized protein n=1 Tax=Acrobeloides nanus TaxID=290746 RepID=A0A914DVV7_9BILA
MNQLQLQAGFAALPIVLWHEVKSLMANPLLVRPVNVSYEVVPTWLPPAFFRCWPQVKQQHLFRHLKNICQNTLVRLSETHDPDSIARILTIYHQRKDGCLFQIRRYGGGPLDTSEEDLMEQVSVDEWFTNFVPYEPVATNWYIASESDIPKDIPFDPEMPDDPHMT